MGDPPTEKLGTWAMQAWANPFVPLQKTRSSFCRPSALAGNRPNLNGLKLVRRLETSRLPPLRCAETWSMTWAYGALAVGKDKGRDEGG